MPAAKTATKTETKTAKDSKVKETKSSKAADTKAAKETKANDAKPAKEPKAAKEPKEPKEPKEAKEAKETKASKEKAADSKLAKESKPAKETKSKDKPKKEPKAKSPKKEPDPVDTVYNNDYGKYGKILKSTINAEYLERIEEIDRKHSKKEKTADGEKTTIDRQSEEYKNDKNKIHFHRRNILVQRGAVLAVAYTAQNLFIEMLNEHLLCAVDGDLTTLNKKALDDAVATMHAKPTDDAPNDYYSPVFAHLWDILGNTGDVDGKPTFESKTKQIVRNVWGAHNKDNTGSINNCYPEFTWRFHNLYTKLVAGFSCLGYDQLVLMRPLTVERALAVVRVVLQALDLGEFERKNLGLVEKQLAKTAAEEDQKKLEKPGLFPDEKARTAATKKLADLRKQRTTKQKELGDLKFKNHCELFERRNGGTETANKEDREKRKKKEKDLKIEIKGLEKEATAILQPKKEPKKE